VPGGVYALALLVHGVSEPAALQAAAAAGVWADGLASHRMTGGDDGPAGILLGYANLSEPALARAVALLGEALAHSGRRTPTSSR
jgi:DNA-binding transcriptional MocR family regulator